MKKTLKKITLLFFACLFLMINSIGSNVAFGSYSSSQFQKTSYSGSQQAAVYGWIVAGVAAFAGTVTLVYEAGTTVGKAAYYYLGEDVASNVCPIENPNDFSKFDVI
jgi:hypothetical protein